MLTPIPLFGTCSSHPLPNIPNTRLEQRTRMTRHSLRIRQHSAPKQSLSILHDLRSVRDVVVDQLRAVDVHVHAAMREVLAQAPVHDAIRVLVVEHRVEQAVPVELRVVAARISAAKRKALPLYRILPEHRRRARHARGALPVRELAPGPLRPAIHVHATRTRVDHEQPGRVVPVALGTSVHLGLAGRNRRLVGERASGRAWRTRALQPDLDLKLLGPETDAASSGLATVARPVEPTIVLDVGAIPDVIVLGGLASKRQPHTFYPLAEPVSTSLLPIGN